MIAFKRGGRTRTRDLGRVLIGIGLMLLALHIFLGALVTSDSVPVSRGIARRNHQPTFTVLAHRRGP